MQQEKIAKILIEKFQAFFNKNTVQLFGIQIDIDATIKYILGYLLFIAFTLFAIHLKINRQNNNNKTRSPKHTHKIIDHTSPKRNQNTLNCYRLF